MKQNRKSIEANLRNKLAAQYKEKSDNLQKRLDALRDAPESTSCGD